MGPLAGFAGQVLEPGCEGPFQSLAYLSDLLEGVAPGRQHRKFQNHGHASWHDRSERGSTGSLAKAWLRPSEVGPKVTGCAFEGYDRTQRAYCFSLQSSGKSRGCLFEAKASKSLPLLNPVFLVRNWTHSTAKVKIKGSGQKIEEIRHGSEYGLGENILVVWVKGLISNPVEVPSSPEASRGRMASRQQIFVVNHENSSVRCFAGVGRLFPKG